MDTAGLDSARSSTRDARRRGRLVTSGGPGPQRRRPSRELARAIAKAYGEVEKIRSTGCSSARHRPENMGGRRRRIAIPPVAARVEHGGSPGECAGRRPESLLRGGARLRQPPRGLGLARARELGSAAACLDSRGIQREELRRAAARLLEPPTGSTTWCSPGYLRLLSPAVVRRYPERIVNIHPADTRRHQGLHGYAWAFEQKLATTKVTVHLVDEGLDTGRILAQREVDLRGAASLEEVERRGLAVVTPLIYFSPGGHSSCERPRLHSPHIRQRRSCPPTLVRLEPRRP